MALLTLQQPTLSFNNLQQVKETTGLWDMEKGESVSIHIGR